MRVSRRPAALVPQGLALWLTLVIHGCGLPALVSAVPLDHWTWRNPLPTGNPLTGVAYGNGRFVAIGEAGTILISSDGLRWSPLASGIPGVPQRILYREGNFFLLTEPDFVGVWGASQVVWTSPDGETWTPQPINLTPISGSFALAGLTYGQGQYVAVGSGGGITVGTLTTNGWSTIVIGGVGPVLTSPDLNTWTSQDSTNTDLLFDVAYGNGRFVGVGYFGAILTSTNGTNWTAPNAGTGSSLFRIAYGNGQFVAVGGGNADFANFYPATILTSTDGVAWVQQLILDPSFAGVALNDVAFANGRFVAIGTFGRVVVSTNAVDWLTVDTGTGADLRGVAYGDGRFVAVGGELSNGATSPYSTILMSTDGITWISGITSITHQNFHGIAFGDGRFVAVGDYNVLVSTNGVTWSAPPSGDFPLNGVCYGGGKFVAVGPLFNDGLQGGPSLFATILVSTDGTNWSQVLSPATNALNAVTYGNGLYVAVGGLERVAGGLATGSIVTSPDGTNWTVLNVKATDVLRSVAWGNGWYTAVGGTFAPAIAASPDGVNWTYRTLSPSSPPYSVAFGNGRFATGEMVSTNGINWTWSPGGAGGAITFGDGQFVAAGAGSSYDGVNWTPRNFKASIFLRAIAYGNGQFVAVGDAGTILQSAPAVPVVPAALGPIQLVLAKTKAQITVTGPMGQSYLIQGSTDLSNWVPLMTVTMTNTAAQFLEGSPLYLNKRFYRAIVPQ